MSTDVSVIITSYNNQAYLGRAIRSCLKQSLLPVKYEVIVVDDCSTDESREVIASFGDKIVPVLLEKNVGVAEASNIGIRNALGRFVIRVDSDDYINEHTLLFMSEILNNNPDIGFVYCDHIRVDKEENHLERVNLFTLDLLLRHGAGIMFRKSYMEALGLYNKEFRNAEDHELLSRYIKQWTGFHLPMSLYRYRISDTQMTHDDIERRKWEAKITS